MKYAWRTVSTYIAAVTLCLQLCACGGDSPWRYSPGMPDQPVGLAATPGNGQVSLSWPAATNAAAYNVYYSTSPAVSRATGNRIAQVTGTSYIQTGLANDTVYYFVVTSVNSGGESAESSQVAATPTTRGSYGQGDAEGIWNFNILVSGAVAGWMRGTLTVDAAGTVTFNSFLDSAGNSLAPAHVLPALIMSSDGSVRDSPANTSNFTGVMDVSRNMIVGNSSLNGASHVMAILQKQVPGVTFTNAGDIQGFGNTGGGGRRFIYNQISSGIHQEWECAAGQIGKDQKIQYTTVTAPSHPVKPGDKASMVTIAPDGIVTESMTGASPQPAVVIDRAVMSVDKSVIIGTATDRSAANPRYILRIYQFVNIIPNDPSTFAPADLAGRYDLRKILVGAAARTASGTISVSDSGVSTFSSYAESTGVAPLPVGFSMTMDENGSITSPADSSLSGKLSYFKDMFVVTGTDFSGAYSLGIALKR